MFLCACGPLPNLSPNRRPALRARDENPAILEGTQEPVQLMASGRETGAISCATVRVGGEVGLELTNDGCGDPVELVDWQEMPPGGDPMFALRHADAGGADPA